MPIARYQLPDGRVARFQVPEGTTPEQAQQIGQDYFAQQQAPELEQEQEQPEPAPQSRLSGRGAGAQATGDGRGAWQQLSDAFTGSNRETPEMVNLPEIQNSGLLAGENQAKVGAVAPVLLTTTDPNEIAQIVTSTFPNVGVAYNKDAQGDVYPVLVNNETGARAMVNKPGMSGLDVMQTLGIGAAYTPAGRAGGALALGARSALTESAMQGGQAAAGGDFDVEEVALSGALGGGMKAVENVAGTGYRLARGSASSGPGSELVRQGGEHGVPVFTSDAFPPATFVGKTAQQIGEKIPLLGTGSKRAKQQGAREKAVDTAMDRYNTFSYDAIVESLKGQRDRVKQAAGSVLQKTGTRLDEVGEIPIDNTRNAIAQAQEILTKPGVMSSGGSVEDLRKLSDALSSSPQSFTTLKENRTAFRDIVDSVDPSARSQLTSREKSVLQRVQSAMTEDMDAFARSNLSPREFAQWKRANAVYASQANELKRTRLKNVLDKGDVTPEVIDNLLFSRKPSEVAQLYRGLTPEGRKNAKGAIIGRVVENLSRRQSGITPNSFASELGKYGPQIEVFFRGDDKKYLDGLKAVLEATRRAQDAAISTPTGQQILGVGAGYGAATATGPTLALAGLAGGSARLYESAPVRNALQKLGSVPPGSTRFEKALDEAFRQIYAPSQAARSVNAEGSEPRQSSPR